MSNLKIILFLSVLLTITACQTNTTRPSGFEFIFEYSSCGPEFEYTLDTNKATLTYSPNNNSDSSSVKMQLTDEELDKIYQQIISMEFFEYPEIFVVPDDEIRGYQAPSSTHKLTVINNQQKHSVTWTDEILTEAPYMDEKKLRELALLILNSICNNPNYQSLPGPSEFCA